MEVVAGFGLSLTFYKVSGCVLSGSSGPSSNCQDGNAPIITSVSGLGSSQKDNIVITGSTFGTQTPFDGDTPFIQIADVTGGWNAGNDGTLPSGSCRVSSDGDWVSLNVRSWTDTEIDIGGFTGQYGGLLGWSLNKGDDVQSRCGTLRRQPGQRAIPRP